MGIRVTSSKSPILKIRYLIFFQRDSLKLQWNFYNKLTVFSFLFFPHYFELWCYQLSLVIVSSKTADHLVGLFEATARAGTFRWHSVIVSSTFGAIPWVNVANAESARFWRAAIDCRWWYGQPIGATWIRTCDSTAYVTFESRSRL